MRHTSSKQKSPNQTERTTNPDVSAGPKGVAIAPPEYGIDIVDNQSVGMESEYNQAEQSLESITWPTQNHAIQRKSRGTETNSSLFGRKQPNKTGLPDKLKVGIETLSGLSMDDVKVHFNSPKPTALQALAYTRGTDIYMGPGQKRYLPHEAWHVVQQKQGRMVATTQYKGVDINENPGLEREADVMGVKALQMRLSPSMATEVPAALSTPGWLGQPRKPRSVTPWGRNPWPRGSEKSRYGNQLDPTNVSFQPTPNQCIQRHVGFEYELADFPTQRAGISFGNYFMPEYSWGPHAKGAILKKMNGFNITADQVHGATSEIEIIVHHIDEEDQVARDNLIQNTLPAVENTIEDIRATTAANPGAWVPANNFAFNGSSWDRIRSNVPPPGNLGAVSGQLQMTGGINMNKLSAFVSGNQQTNYAATVPALGGRQADFNAVTQDYAPGGIGTIYAFAAPVVNGNATFNALTQAERDMLISVVALMAKIPITTHQHLNAPNGILDYPKSATGEFLARTDFATIMQALPNTIKALLSPVIMRNLVVGAIQNAPGLGGVNGGDHVFPAALQYVYPPNLQMGRLTIDQWAGSVVPTNWYIMYQSGTDYLTTANYPGTRSQKNILKSMGSLGGRKDRGTDPIFEFRSLRTVFGDQLAAIGEDLIGYLRY